MRISDLSSDVCSSDFVVIGIRQSLQLVRPVTVERDTLNQIITCETQHGPFSSSTLTQRTATVDVKICECTVIYIEYTIWYERSEEHTSELQSLMRISYAVFCLNKKQIPRPRIQQFPTTST